MMAYTRDEINKHINSLPPDSKTAMMLRQLVGVAMTPTFITAGYVQCEYNEDGTTKCYWVSRKGMDTPIRLMKCIKEYYSVGAHIKIDEYGNAWVKK